MTTPPSAPASPPLHDRTGFVANSCAESGFVDSYAKSRSASPDIGPIDDLAGVPRARDLAIRHASDGVSGIRRSIGGAEVS